MNDNNLRITLSEFLTKHPAHVTVKDALSNLKAENRNKRPAPDIKTIWEELEHIRLAQEDILQYTINPDWTSPKWPQGYWPDSVDHLSDETWQSTVERFFQDLNTVLKISNDPSIDLTSKIPHAPKHTYLREILLIIDHNAYHLGKIVQIRKILGNW